MPRRWTGGLGLLAVVLASCGLTSQGASTSPTPLTPSPTASATPIATPTPVPSPASVADCLGAPAATPAASASAPITVIEIDQQQASTLELVDAEGSVVNQTAVEPYGGDPSFPDLPWTVGVGTHGAYLYYPSTGEIARLGTDGPLQDLGDTVANANGSGAGTGTELAGLAESPNGECWILSLVSWSAPTGTSETATSQLYVGGVGSVLVHVATLSRDNSSGGGYQVLRWDQSGVLLGTNLTGVGGAGPFIGEGYTFASVERFDPVSGTVGPSLCATGRFLNLAPDGTLACLVGVGSDARIQLTPPGGSTSVIDTGVALAGHLEFVGGSSLAAYCTSDGVNTGSGWTEKLWAAQLGSSPVSTHLVTGGDLNGCESGVAAGPGSMVELVGGDQGGSPSLVFLDLTTGATTNILAPAPDVSIVGVLGSDEM